MPSKTNWIIKFLQGTYNHYSLELPDKPGFFTGFFLNRFFSGVRIEDEQIDVLNNLPENAIIVYVAKQKSRFQYLLYYMPTGSWACPTRPWDFTTVYSSCSLSCGCCASCWPAVCGS